MGANVDDWGLSVIKVIKPYIYIWLKLIAIYGLKKVKQYDK
jgi:hypothetical protein